MSSLRRYFVVRSVQTVVMLAFVMTALFVLFRSMPGDFTAQMATSGADAETLQQIRDQWGLRRAALRSVLAVPLESRTG